MSRTYRKVPQEVFETHHPDMFDENGNPIDRSVKQIDNKHQTYTVFDGETDKNKEPKSVEVEIDNREKIKNKDDKKLDKQEQ